MGHRGGQVHHDGTSSWFPLRHAFWLGEGSVRPGARVRRGTGQTTPPVRLEGPFCPRGGLPGPAGLARSHRAATRLVGVLVVGFDTATPAVSVALHDGERVVSEASAADGRRHGELLTPMIAQVL